MKEASYMKANKPMYIKLLFHPAVTGNTDR